MTQALDAAIRASCTASGITECTWPSGKCDRSCEGFAENVRLGICAALPAEPTRELIEALEDAICESFSVEIHERVQAPVAYFAVRAHILGGDA